MQANDQHPYGAPPQAPGPGAPDPHRTLFVLAGVGAVLASLYWGALTLLIGLGAATGTVSGTQAILPFVLVALYAVRAVQLFKGNPTAAKSILWLHGIGGVMAIVQMASGGIFLIVLQGVKVLIHVFGGVTAFLALRSWRAASLG